jgi:hypothetical protein
MQAPRADTVLGDFHDAVLTEDSKTWRFFTKDGKYFVRTNDVIDFHTQSQLGRLDSLQALRAWVDACVAEAESVYLRGGCVYGSLTGELLEADDGILDDLAAGYDQWLTLFRDGLRIMRRRGDLTDDADPRHLAVALVVAHQGGAMLTHATGTAEPLCAMVNAAVDYVASFCPTPGRRTSRSVSRPRSNR